MKYDNEMWIKNFNKRSEIEAKRKLHNGLSFDLLGIKGSPVTEGYRNKCEFTVGYDEENQLTVGFRLGAYATGTICVGPVAELNHISDAMKEAVIVSILINLDSPYNIILN